MSATAWPFSALLVTLLPSVAGHAEVTWPPARSQGAMGTAGSCMGPNPDSVPQNGTCLWFNEGCTIGCNSCIGEKCKEGFSCCGDDGGTAMAPKLNDPKFRTIFGKMPWPLSVLFPDPTKHNPWRAPGFAPVFSPCGLAGGSYEADDGTGTGGWPPVGIRQGTDQRDMPPVATPVQWPAGSRQEVAWSMRANHGGGYAWRLCPKSAGNLTEACFQEHHLPFVGNTTWIQYGDTAVPQGTANRTAIPAVRVSEGTKPAGSQWTRNPIPLCSGLPYGGAQMHAGCDAPMFPAPIDAEGLLGVTQRGLYGYGQARCTSRLAGKTCSPEEYNFWGKRFNFNLIDLIQVPRDIPAGQYVLSFRWDCEQTPQIWTGCSDVAITV